VVLAIKIEILKNNGGSISQKAQITFRRLQLSKNAILSF
jgi:hypothetical protein